MTARAVDQDMPTVIEPLIYFDRNTVIQAIGVPAQREIALDPVLLELFPGNANRILAH
ncbi:hypothetical protein D3C75_1375660 [compost metagenome]